jgi:hypothetical protein
MRGCMVISAGAALAIACLVGGCADGVSADPGLRDVLRVPNAQYVPGPMPADTSGPPVTSVGASASIVRAGRSTSMTGLVPRPTQAVALGVTGDAGYWIITPGAADLMLPDQLTFTTRIAVASTAQPGDLPIVVRAVSPDGKFGPPSTVMLMSATSAVPDGQLVISLAWDSQSDLDLHVVEPDGVEIWSRNLNSYQPPPPGQLPDPNAWKAGGILDFDSNSQCVLDGRRLEDVVWTETPPSGHYIVRVDTFSLCAEVGASWTVAVKLHDQEIARVHGQSRDADVRGVHAQGSGLQALEFDVP